MKQTMRKTKLTSDSPKSSREARAKRLTSLRGMTTLTRKDFAEKCGILPGNFQNWEGPRYGGLTENGAKQIIRAVKALGIHCSLEWLMHGIDPGPQITEQLYFQDQALHLREIKKAYSADEELSLITEELLLFRKHYPNTMDYTVNDDGMEPTYKIGEYVAGNSRYHQQIENLVGLDCIVKTMDGEIFLRHVKKGREDGRYTLVCINSKTSVEKPILYDVELFSAAPVIWIRRKDLQPSS